MLANSPSLRDLVFRKMVVLIGRQDIGLDDLAEVKVSSIEISRDGRLSYMESSLRIDV